MDASVQEVQDRYDAELAGLEARRRDVERCEAGLSHAESLLEKLSDEIRILSGQYTDSAITLAVGKCTVEDHGKLVDRLRHLKAAVEDVEDCLPILKRELSGASHRVWQAQGACDDWKRTLEHTKMRSLIKSALDHGLTDGEVMEQTGCSEYDLKDFKDPTWRERERRLQDGYVPFSKILERR